MLARKTTFGFFRNQNYLITTIFFLTVNNFLISLTLTKILLAWIESNLKKRFEKSLINLRIVPKASLF